MKRRSIAAVVTAARRVLGTLAVLLLSSPALAAGGAEPVRPPRAARAPVIDGRLDDEAWQHAWRVTGFKTWMPDYGVTMTDQTIAYVSYDAENLYFAFRALDSEPSKIKASMANRDNIRPDDWICINLDSFNDQQALSGFYVNPLGIQMDSRFTGNQEDFGFDAVWYSAGTVDEGGYSIEVRIPFKSLRYRGRSPVTMGVVFERFISRRNEDGTWPALDPKAGVNFLIQTAPIELKDIKHYTLLELLPDAVYNRQDVARAGSLQPVSSGGDFGVTGKYGITAQLTADGTYNPDFSQVEADAGQIDVNLRAPLFFPEKRPFFLEGQDVFVLGGPSQQSPLQSVIHTRTIVNPQAGFKVSGKVGGADTLSSLYALDDVRSQEKPEWAHVAVMRYKRSLDQDAYLGGYYVGREQGSDYNRVAGVDGRLRLDRSSNIGLYAFGSDTRAGTTSATSGHAVGFDFMRETRALSVYAMAVDISTGFAAESGYLTRNGVTSFLGAIVPRLYPKHGVVQRVDLSGTSSQTRDAFSGIWESSTQGAVTLRMKRAATLKVAYAVASEVYNGEEFPTSGPSALASMQVVKQLRVQASFGRYGAIYYAADPFGGTTNRAAATIVYQPSEQWSQTFSASYATFTRTDGVGVYDYTIARSRTSYQVNRFLFFRAIFEYNWFRRQLLTDLLASFTYIPGTVLHAGYGSLYERSEWDGAGYVRSPRFEEMRRGVFLKASYLWRM